MLPVKKLSHSVPGLAANQIRHSTRQEWTSGGHQFQPLLKPFSTLNSGQAAHSFVQLGLSLSDLTVSLGNPFQCLNIIILKYVFFISSWNSLSQFLIAVSHSLSLPLTSDSWLVIFSYTLEG